MKILIVSNVFPPGFIGGYELAALDVARGLERRGHEIRVMTSDYFQDDGSIGDLPDVFRGLECVSLTHERRAPDPLEASRHNFANLRVLGAALRSFRPDVVMTFNLMGLGALGIVRYLQAARVPTVLYLMDDVFASPAAVDPVPVRYDRLCGRFELARTTRVIAMSRSVATEAAKTLGCDVEDAVIVPGWVHEASASPPPLAGRSRPRRFVYCSRVAGHKGVDIMLDAATEVAKQGEAFSIDVWGAGQVGPFLQSVAARGLSDTVRYRGVAPRDEVQRILAGHDALLFPTWRREPFGFVAVEAAMAGCVPVMTAGIGASDWFLDGHDCLKIAPHARSLLAAMRQLILADDSELHRMREAAAQTARRSFGFSRWLPRIEEVCRDACRGYDGAAAASRSRRVEAAMLLLGELSREAG